MHYAKLSGIGAFVEGFYGKPFAIGIDVHKASYSVALFRADGQTKAWRGPADPAGLVKMFRGLKIRVSVVVYEAGPTGFQLARVLSESGYQVKVVAPSKVLRPVTQGAKTDCLDCLALAELAAKNMCRGIAIPTVEEEALRGLNRHHQSLSRSIRVVRQRIKSLLLRMGVKYPDGLEHWSQKAFAELAIIDLPPADRYHLDSLLREESILQDERKRVREALSELVNQSEQKQAYENLQTTPGVGTIIATTFALEIFRPGRFNRAEEVTSYLGLAPMVRHSGEHTPRGKLYQTGQKHLRSLLIEAAWMWKSKDDGAKAIYNKLYARSGVPQKAITALARKLAVILWRISVEKRPYYPCP